MKIRTIIDLTLVLLLAIYLGLAVATYLTTGDDPAAQADAFRLEQAEEDRRIARAVRDAERAGELSRIIEARPDGTGRRLTERDGIVRWETLRQVPEPYEWTAPEAPEPPLTVNPQR